MSLRLLILSCWLAFLLGCGKKATLPPAPTASQDAGKSVLAPPSNRPPPTAGSTADDLQMATALSQMTQAVRKYAVEQRKAPKNLSEVAAAGYLSSVPVAPAGKQFAISQKLEVYLSP